MEGSNSKKSQSDKKQIQNRIEPLINRRMKKIIQKKQKEEIKNKQINRCAICLCDQNVDWATLQCSHGFCLKCLNKWWVKHKTCPYCRQKFDSFIDDKGKNKKMIDVEDDSSQDEDFTIRCQMCWMEIQQGIMFICFRCRSIYVHASCIGRDCHPSLLSKLNRHYWVCDECKIQRFREESQSDNQQNSQQSCNQTYLNNTLRPKINYTLRKRR